ncbi:hypothetical protein AWB80_06172 [Caballeronia pedi]|uniref:Uncharacterized protein n=1 Tax=Caballeronia pedi TaxID=1777141 RepID=A0A158D1U6_9BURK|nr:hypothetical protein AWB80_06172 [Caballeronia pedi]
MSPRPMESVPSVAMKGGNWIHVIMTPLNAPTTSPTESPHNTAANAPKPC